MTVVVVNEARRLALTRKEAAEALVISLTSFKQQVQPEVRVVRRGSLRLIPIAELERWLAENASSMAEEVAA